MSKRPYSKTKAYQHKWYRENKTIYKAWIKTGGVDKDGDPIKYHTFKQQVKYRMRSDRLNAREASKKYLNTDVFTSAAARSRYNLTQSIKEQFPQAYKEMSEINKGLRGDHGRFTSMYSNLKWNNEFKGYVLGDYLIDVSNSPKGVYITPIDKMRKVV